MWGERLQALRERPLIGLLASLTIHMAVIAALLFAASPFGKIQVKRGEPLFVELPNIPEPAPAGNPAAKSTGPPVEEASPQMAKPAPPPPPVAKPAPPAPSHPAPRPPVVASRPAPPEPPRPQPAPARPTPPPPPATPDAAPNAPEAAPTAPATPATPEPTPPAPRPPSQSATPAPPSPPAQPQVAALPPSAQTPPPVDIRSALRRGGGAGGTTGGRGGIEGEPIPLNSTDPNFSDYLDRVRRQIKQNWGYPCVKNGETRECEYKTASLVVEFGILKAGVVQFVEVRRSSGFAIYDDYAVNAIKLGSPFPPVPKEMMVHMKVTSTGVSIVAIFTYMVDTSLTNFLR